MKRFDPKKFQIYPRVKSAILAIFQNGLGWPCPVRLALKNPSQELKKKIVLGADEYIERPEGKIRESLFFCVKIF